MHISSNFCLPGFASGTSGGSIFGSPTPATGGIFGATAQPTAQGVAAQAATAGTAGGGLFGGGTNTAFGAQKPAFGFASGTSTGLFGQTQTQPAQTTSLFGQPAAQPAQAGGLFGSSFGGGPTFGATAGPTGTTIKFNPPAGTDSMVRAIIFSMIIQMIEVSFSKFM